MSLTKQQLILQLAAQDELNRLVHPEWWTQNFDWTRAAMMEAAELLDYMGWRWWKKEPQMDLTQCKLELVDIWHFILSEYLQQMYDAQADRGEFGDASANVLHYYLNREGGALVHGFEKTINFRNADVRQRIECFIAGAAMGHMHLKVFESIMQKIDLSWEQLHALYFAKGVLNRFRQDHGYKVGTYVKTWSGQEDNLWLAGLVAQNPAATEERLYEQLEQLYMTHNSKDLNT